MKAKLVKMMLVQFAAVAVFAATPATAQTQSYPSKPIRIVTSGGAAEGAMRPLARKLEGALGSLGYSTGGTADSAMRSLAPLLAGVLGQPVNIEAKPGAAGAVAVNQIAPATPDGYSLAFTDSAPLTIAPHLGKPGYSPLTSFTYIGAVCTLPSVLLTHPSVPAKTVNELVALAKREPAKWSYATPGAAGPHHMSGELFNSVNRITMQHIPYNGGVPALTDLLGGQVPLMFAPLALAAGPVKNGSVRALAVTSLKRSAIFPTVPTLDESGIKGFESTAWFSLIGPANLPANVVLRLAQALAKAGEDKGLQESYRQQGCELDLLSPAATLEKVKADFAKWGKLVKDANIKG